MGMQLVSKKYQITVVVVSIVSVVLLLVLSVGIAQSLASNSDTSNDTEETTVVESNPPITTESGLVIEDIAVGTGARATRGSEIDVHYRGTLEDGTQFDSSYDRGEPFTFTLGAQQVIAGWDEGVEGMRVGGRRNLTIPPELGYGSRETGSIPANSTLNFTIELLAVN
jgi:FKBP-type peptidyl-prolyl cis-trans isomerase